LLVLLMLLCLRIWDPPPVEELRLRASDLYQLLYPRPVTARPAVIVDIDEKSLATYGQWPWPRTLIADLVSRLQQMESVVIAFDVVFPEPDRSSPEQAVKHFRGLDPQTRRGPAPGQGGARSVRPVVAGAADARHGRPARNRLRRARPRSVPVYVPGLSAQSAGA
jgi:hypothetical protein